MRLARNKPFVSWCLYNTALGMLITGFTICYPLFFTNFLSISKASGTADWAIILTISNIIAAITCPFIGAIVDATDRKKLSLAILSILATIITGSFYLIKPAVAYRHFFIVLIVIIIIVFTALAVVYSAVLPFLKINDDLGKGSNLGFACLSIGYIIGTSFSIITKHTTSLFYFYSWFLPLSFVLLSAPFWYYYNDQGKEESTNTQSAKNILQEVVNTIKALRSRKNILLYTIARALIIDGLVTYLIILVPFLNSQYKLTQSTITLFIGTLAFPTMLISSFIWGWLDDKIGAKKVLLMSSAALYLFLSFSLFAHKVIFFKFSFIIACLFMSPQVTSMRSLLVRITPDAKITEVLGFTALVNRILLFLGTGTYYLIYKVLHSQRTALAASLIFIPLGTILLAYIKEEKNEKW